MLFLSFPSKAPQVMIEKSCSGYIANFSEGQVRQIYNLSLSHKELLFSFMENLWQDFKIGTYRISILKMGWSPFFSETRSVVCLGYKLMFAPSAVWDSWLNDCVLPIRDCSACQAMVLNTHLVVQGFWYIFQPYCMHTFWYSPSLSGFLSLCPALLLWFMTVMS